MKKALAFDIGGTKIYSTVVDETGKIVSEIDKFSTPKTLDEIKDTFGKGSVLRATSELEGSTVKIRNSQIGGHRK